jgi:hypothetical protein
MDMSATTLSHRGVLHKAAPARRWGRLGWIGAAAVVVLVIQPIHSRTVQVLELLAIASAWIGLLVHLGRRRWPWLVAALLAPLLLVATLLLPGRAPEVPSLRRAYVQALQRYEGTAYLWGGENRLGIDCSGLVRRGLLAAAASRALRELNPRLLREAASLWWHDASARALRDGHRELTVPLLSAASLNELDHEQLRPGDLAVTSDGVHVLAYLGDRTWIASDPEQAEVIRMRAPNISVWFRVPVRLLRWRLLSEGEGN